MQLSHIYSVGWWTRSIVLTPMGPVYSLHSSTNGFDYLALEGLVHGCRIFKYLACFVVCLIGLLAVRGCGIFRNGCKLTRIVQVFI